MGCAFVPEISEKGLTLLTIRPANPSDARAIAKVQNVARLGKRQIHVLLKNAGIIRNRAKTLAAVNNAGRFLQVQEEFGNFDTYIRCFLYGCPIAAHLKIIGPPVQSCVVLF